MASPQPAFPLTVRGQPRVEGSTVRPAALPFLGRLHANLSRARITLAFPHTERPQQNRIAVFADAVTIRKIIDLLTLHRGIEVELKITWLSLPSN